MKSVLVTGATGFIGRRLCKALLENNVKLHVLGRTSPKLDVDFQMWDMLEPLASKALSGIDTVFHLAAKAHALAESQQDIDDYFSINTEATKSLLEACKQSGVKTFVYFSSVKAVADCDAETDESFVAPPSTPYGESKLAAEHLVLAGGFVPHPVVIRPSMVYGNTEKGNLSKMINAVAKGRFPPMPQVQNRRSMVHVDDVVQAAILASESSRSSGQVYNVTDGHVYSTRQMYEWICAALHKPVPGWNVPLSVLKMLGKVGDVVGFLSGKRFVFDSDALNKLTGSALYSSEKIRNELGFRPSRNLRDSLPEIVQFLGLDRP